MYSVSDLVKSSGCCCWGQGGPLHHNCWVAVAVGVSVDVNPVHSAAPPPPHHNCSLRYAYHYCSRFMRLNVISKCAEVGVISLIFFYYL